MSDTVVDKRQEKLVQTLSPEQRGWFDRLTNALGEDVFDAEFGELKVSSLSKESVIAIASAFMGYQMPKSTTKISALEKIQRRHQKLLTFKLKRKAMAGKSAA